MKTNKKEKVKLTKEQKEIISDRLAELLFNFLQNEENNNKNIKTKGYEATTLNPGFPRKGFPENKVVTL